MGCCRVSYTRQAGTLILPHVPPPARARPCRTAHDAGADGLRSNRAHLGLDAMQAMHCVHNSSSAPRADSSPPVCPQPSQIATVQLKCTPLKINLLPVVPHLFHNLVRAKNGLGSLEPSEALSTQRQAVSPAAVTAEKASDTRPLAEPATPGRLPLAAHLPLTCAIWLSEVCRSRARVNTCAVANRLAKLAPDMPRQAYAATRKAPTMAQAVSLSTGATARRRFLLLHTNGPSSWPAGGGTGSRPWAVAPRHCKSLLQASSSATVIRNWSRQGCLELHLATASKRVQWAWPTRQDGGVQDVVANTNHLNDGARVEEGAPARVQHQALPKLGHVGLHLRRGQGKGTVKQNFGTARRKRSIGRG